MLGTYIHLLVHREVYIAFHYLIDYLKQTMV